MIRLPRFGTNITECFATSTRWSTMHIITTHWSFNVFLAEWTYFGIQSQPISICFFLHDYFFPPDHITTATRTMDFTPTSETELFPTVAFNFCQQGIFRINTILAISSWTEFNIMIGLYIFLTKVLNILLFIRWRVLCQPLNWWIENNRLTILFHTLYKNYFIVHIKWDMLFPTVHAETMSTKVLHWWSCIH